MTFQSPSSFNIQFLQDENFIRKIADTSPGMIAVYNISTGKYIYVNNAVRKILGYEPEDFLEGGINFASSLVHPDDFPKVMEKNIDALNAANSINGLSSDSDFIVNFEYRMKHKNGNYIWLHSDGSVFSRDKDNKVEYVLNISVDITAAKEVENRLHKLTTQLEEEAHRLDLLTGLPNRRWFKEEITRRVSENKEPFSILLIDLDRFKLINESLGHPAGDFLLKEVGMRIKNCLECDCDLARFGGDEFAIICKQLASPKAKDLANKILADFRCCFNLTDKEIYITPSIGITSYPDDSGKAEELIQCAEIALYNAKEQGKNNYQFYNDEMSIMAGYDVNLESNLRHSIEEEHLVVHYQPQVKLQTGEILGVEALVRIQDKNQNLTYPDKFIPLAEVTGLIEPLCEFVLKSACRKIKSWNENGHPNLKMAVNISSRQFKRKEFMYILEKIIDETQIKPANLELELTERVLLESSPLILRNMKKMSRKGIIFSLDDFSMGYSSLNYIQKFPLDVLKIDRNFLRGIPKNKINRAIAQSIINLGHNLGMTVVAEGVETVEQLKFLHDHGCDKVQGYIFNGAIPADSVSDILRERRYTDIISKVISQTLPLSFVVN